MKEKWIKLLLNELETELDDLPRKEKDKVMNEYEDIFYNQETKRQDRCSNIR